MIGSKEFSNVTVFYWFMNKIEHHQSVNYSLEIEEIIYGLITINLIDESKKHIPH